MSKRSLDDLIRLSKTLLAKHGTLSTAFLMRKFKVDYEEAQKIMQAHGLPIYITVEEYGSSR
jgi:hypothetical protein